MDNDAKLVMIVLAVAAFSGVAYWYFVHRAPVEVSGAPPAEVAKEPGDDRTREQEPSYPLPDPPAAPEIEQELPPLPTLADSDEPFELALLELFGDGVGDILVDGALIEKVVATIDNLPRSQVAERIRPAGAPAGEFRALDGDDEESFVLGPENFQRYDRVADWLAGADRERVFETYRRFYPLLQEAYVGLGYPDGYFNDRAVEVIDHLLAAPQPEPPIRLLRPHVLYEFADPEIESLSAGQKLMIRIGPQNAEKVRRFLADLRSAIVEGD